MQLAKYLIAMLAANNIDDDSVNVGAEESNCA